jgi:hypothetical protein
LQLAFDNEFAQAEQRTLGLRSVTGGSRVNRFGGVPAVAAERLQSSVYGGRTHAPSNHECHLGAKSDFCELLTPKS